MPATAAVTVRTEPRRAVAAPSGAAWSDALSVAEVPALPARTVQLLLSARGLLAPAEVTGRFDRVTGAAVRAFQRARGLDVTGVASRVTADALLADDPR